VTTTHAVTGLAIATTGPGPDALTARVTEHAVDPTQATSHRAVCGAPLPVVDRGRPWAGAHEGCCAVCAALLPAAAA
jgi:hypothetical protein